MKNLACLTLVFLTLLACDKKDSDAEDLSKGVFFTQKNQIDWNGTTQLLLTESDTLIFLGDGDGIDNGLLTIKLKFKGKGLYQIENSHAIYYDTLGDDAIIAKYATESGKKFNFVISEYDENEGLIEGTFNVTLKATQLYGRIERDSLLTITNGRFNGRIKTIF